MIDIDEEEIYEKLDKLEEEPDERYKDFVNYGKNFVRVMENSIPAIENKWADTEDILEEADKVYDFTGTGGERKFAGIYNLLVEIDLFTTSQRSSPYHINTEEFDRELLVNSWEYASGEDFDQDESLSELEPDISDEKLLDQLKD